MQCQDLAHMAKDCGVVTDARVVLKMLVLTVLKQNMDKSGDVRSSKWNATSLSDNQNVYAALDAMKSMEVCCKLLPIPDLTQ